MTGDPEEVRSPGGRNALLSSGRVSSGTQSNCVTVQRVPAAQHPHLASMRITGVHLFFRTSKSLIQVLSLLVLPNSFLKFLQRDFPGCPVAKTPSSQSRRPRCNPWSEKQIPQATTNSWHAFTKKDAASLLSKLVSVSVPALQIGSSISIFQITYICAIIHYFSLSDLTLLCITGSCSSTSLELTQICSFL